MNYVILFAALVAVVLLLLSGFRIAAQYKRAVVFRLGRYRATKGPGLYWIIPLIEWQTMLDLRTVTDDVESQETITKDNVPVKVDAVVWYRIVSPESAVMEVQDVRLAITQVALTALRNVIGEHSLDDILKEREQMTTIMRAAIDRITAPWGIKVEMVEMKDVEIPQTMQRAMAQEAEALREKRARIIKAQAELEAAHQLRQASEVIMQNPAGLELRRMQMITEVGAEQNTTTIIMMPSEFVSVASALAKLATAKAA